VIDFDTILTTLDNNLPMIPGRPEVVQVNPPPFKDPIRITFGKLMPKEKKDKDEKKAAKKAKPPARKGKDDKPPKPILWADPPGKPLPTTLDLLRQVEKDVNENVFPLHIRQEHCNPGVMPIIIKEVFFPPDAPKEVATLMESSLIYQNSANYEMAVKSLEDARELWRKLITPK
jgi:hypothetical protein